jgi:gamma-polyglutamate biosynthesis protein CapA
VKKEKIITLLGVGDVMLGDSPVCYGFGVASMVKKFGPIFPFVNVMQELKMADILFGNLEVALSGFDETKDSFKSIQYRGQPETIEGLVQAKFDVLSLATNHTMQHGRQAFHDTLDILSGHNIKFTGVEIPEQHITNHCILEKNDYKFCFLGYNFRPQQYFIDPPLWKDPNFQMIKQDIDLVRDSVDFVIVSIHWGDEFINYPSPLQVELAHKIIDEGASIILGHHPHILQGIEKYHGGIIAYSLGNFIFDMWQYRLRKSMILKCVISKPSDIDFEIIPVVINNNHQPELARGREAENLEKEIRSLSLRITDDKSILESYNLEVRKNLRRFRRETYWYYITHLFRYNPRHLLANFFDAIGKRLKK